MPQRTEKPGIDANIAEHRPLYLFGLNLEKEGLTPTDRTGKAQKSHAAFVETNLKFIEEMEESSKTNQIYLDGYICKEPVYRKTPLGREIADLLLAVNRPYGKSDYIPCICWGRNARYAEHFKVGERCAIWGRIQSREYMKKLDEEHVEKRVAFEVSVSKLELLEEAQVQESIV
jgi:primosomal replication protein N